MSDRNSSRIPPPPDAHTYGQAVDPYYSQSLARDAFGREISEPGQQSLFEGSGQNDGLGKRPKEKATDALGRRAGALADELDFPAFVASLVHGTFDAIVDSSIRQMESFADLVSAVSKPLDQFTQENVTRNQARDWLTEQFPADIELVDSNDGPRLVPTLSDEEDFVEAPTWLADFGHEGEQLNTEFLEETLLPVARERVAQQRLSTLATMVLLGMNRVVVKDGSVGARLRFRAAAADHAAVEYATDNDPDTGATVWGRRGSERSAVTKVSTVGVNVQSDSELKAELFGDVKINFASETVPLDRFIDEAQRSLLERHSRRIEGRAAAPVATAPAIPVQITPAVQVPAPQPTSDAIAQPPVAPPVQAPVPETPGGGS